MNEADMFGNSGKVDQAIQYLKTFEPKEGYVLAFSGGKDSVVIKALADKANVKYNAVYNNTTVDPPELVRFVRSFPDVEFSNPRKSMRELIIQNGMPTQMHRFCCRELKEKSYPGRLTITGVRWSESAKRSKNSGLVNVFGETKNKGIILNTDNDEARRVVENCYRTNKVLVNPIINWSDDDVWEYIKSENIRYCELYDQGFERLGCIGCPMRKAEYTLKDFERWPKYKTYYLNAFRDYIKRRKTKGNYNESYPQNENEMFDKWMQMNTGRNKEITGDMYE